MNDRRRRVFVGVALIAAVTGLGAAWFALVEGFGLVDALYQSTITVSTVGFGEVEPLDRSGRLFTIVLIVVGVAALGYALAGFVELVVESALDRITTRRRDRTLDRLSGHTIVCGFGRTGTSVTQLLRPSRSVGVIELDGGRIEEADARGVTALHGDCTDEAVLRRAGITRADALIVCLANDSDAISTVLSARAMHDSLRIITRVSETRSESKLYLAGADQVVSPIDMAARRLVADTLHPDLGGFLDAAVHDTGVDLSIRAVAVGTVSTGPVPLAGLEDATGARIIGRKGAEGHTVTPTMVGAAEIERGGMVFVAGSASQLDAFEAALAVRAEGPAKM